MMRVRAQSSIKIQTPVKPICLVMTFIVIASLLFAPNGAAYAYDGTKTVEVSYSGLSITVDGKTILTNDAAGKPVYPFIMSGRTYLPVRAVSSALSCRVVWNDASSTVELYKDGGGEPLFGAPGKRTGTASISAVYRNIRVTIDGKPVDFGLDEPFLLSGTVYVPFRAVAATLGCSVGFNAATSTVLIITPKDSVTGNTQTTASGNPGSTAGSVTTPAAPVTPPTAPSAPSVPTVTEPPASAVSSGSFTSEDLAVLIGGTRAALGDDISVFTDILGRRYEYEEAVSCAYGGTDQNGNEKMDKKFSYRGISASTLPISGDIISAIDIEASSAGGDVALSTTKGIKVGDTREQVVAAYGDNYKYDADFGELSYWLGAESPKTPVLSFMIDATGTVTFIALYDGKAAG